MSFEELLQNATNQFTPVIDAAVPLSGYMPIDLSTTNDALSGLNQRDANAFQQYVEAHLQQHQKIVTYGGYNEKRGLYDGNASFGEDARNIHLGVDFWIAAGTTVIAPLSGEIHSFQNNHQFGDYGPTILLKHQLDSVEFYTLYGHLSERSLQGLSIGMNIQKGQPIATLGTPEENIGYAPHLHFQIIKDLQGNTGDYPGVCNANDLEFYLQNCPDPNLLLKID